MIRNATTFEKFVPLSTNGNEVMVYANCPSVYNGPFVGYWDFQCQQKVRDAQGEPPGDESQVALYWRSLGFDYAREHIGELPRVVTLRVLRQWELFHPLQNVDLGGIEGRNHEASTMGLMMFYGLASLSVVGLVWMHRRRIPLLPMVVPFLGVTITSAYTYGSVRFRAPAEPALCVLGAVGLVPVVAFARRWLARGSGEVLDSAPFVLGGSGGLRPRLAGTWQRGAGATWAAIGFVGALIALPLRGLYHTTGGTMEEAFMMVFPERMLKGDLPNRDFLHLYGPGALQVLMGWYKIVGISLESERTFGLIQHLGIIFALFALARPWGRIAAAAVAGMAVFYVLTPIGLTAMAWNGGLALCLWSIVFALRARSMANPRRSLIAAGILAGLALTYRPDLALALVLVYGWYLWRNRHWRTVLLAAVVGMLPMWVHVALVGPSTAFRGMVIDPVFKLRAGRALPRPPSWSHLDGSLQAIAELVPPWWKVPALVGREVAVPVVLRHADRSGGLAVDRDAPVARRAHPAGRDLAVWRVVQPRSGATGAAATRFDAPVVGHVHLVPAADPGGDGAREGPPATYDDAPAAGGWRRRRARRSPWSWRRCSRSATTSCTPASAPATCRPRFPSRATVAASTSATSGRTWPAAT